MNQSEVIGTQELKEKLDALDGAVKGAALVDALKVGGEVILTAAGENIRNQGLIKTGNLRRSMHIEVTESTETEAAVEVGTNVEYAAIHEFGGVIKPKNGKYLAIPVGSYKGSPRAHDDLKLRKTAGGTLIMVDASGTVQYVLKTSVEIPARPYLRPAFDENQQKAEDEIGNAFKNLILKAIE